MYWEVLMTVVAVAVVKAVAQGAQNVERVATTGRAVTWFVIFNPRVQALSIVCVQPAVLMLVIKSELYLVFSLTTSSGYLRIA